MNDPQVSVYCVGLSSETIADHLYCLLSTILTYYLGVFIVEKKYAWPTGNVIALLIISQLREILNCYIFQSIFLLY